jgi:hypothetical protein
MPIPQILIIDIYLLAENASAPPLAFSKTLNFPFGEEVML